MAAAARRKRRRAVLGLFLLLFLTAVAAGLVWGAKRVMFSDNLRFKLRRVEIIGGTYWKGREEKLAARIGLRPGANLFALDYPALRRRVELIPGIEECEIVRVLPDKLQFRVLERIPRLSLFNPNSPWVADEHGVLIPRDEAMPSGRLPVYSGIRQQNLQAGAVIKELLPALKLVMMAVRNFPDIRILLISRPTPESLKFYLCYRTRDRAYQAVMPTRNRGMAILLSALQTAIINVRRNGDPRTKFNLLYDGRVVLSQ